MLPQPPPTVDQYPEAVFRQPPPPIEEPQPEAVLHCPPPTNDLFPVALLQ